MKTFYVYRIANKENNKHYYGYRKTEKDPKLDLGIKYFSSSTDKEFINEQKLNRDKFKYKVIKICETQEEALNLEIKLHKKFNVAKNSNFYNKSIQTSTKFIDGNFGKKMSEKNKELIKQRMLGHKNPMYNIGEKHPLKLKGGHSEESKQLMSKTRLSLNIKYDEEYKNKMSITLKQKKINVGEKNGNFGKHLSDEQKENLRNKNLGIKRSEYSKERSRISALNRVYKTVICPICNKEGKIHAMKRWHFENCKKDNK